MSNSRGLNTGSWHGSFANEHGDAKLAESFHLGITRREEVSLVHSLDREMGHQRFPLGKSVAPSVG